MQHRRWLPFFFLYASAALAQAPGTPSLTRPQPVVERPKQGNYLGEPGIAPSVLTEGFLSAHPDLRWRREALHDYANQRYFDALQKFLRSARYADKPAQAMIAEMYWEGKGVTQDRELAYAWMDLAAERMYANFLIQREKYWSALDETQRRNAIARGQPLLAEYGDEVAKVRMAKALRRARTTTGSRAGFVGNLVIIPFTGPDAGTGMTIRGEDYYAAKYWQSDRYFEWQDQMWKAPLRKGTVEVGELQNAGQPPAAPQQDP